MKKKSIATWRGVALLLPLSLTWAAESQAQSYLLPAPKADVMVPFDWNAAGIQRDIEWGLDNAWISVDNIRRGIAWMDTTNVGIVRISYQANTPLNNGQLTRAMIADLDTRIANAELVSKTVPLCMNFDQEKGIDPTLTSHKNDASAWFPYIKAAKEYAESQGHTMVSIAAFNEPDYTAWGQGSKQTFTEINKMMKEDSSFDGVRLCGGNTLNDDQALSWYNASKAYLDEGNTHQLAGSFANYARFFETVRKDGKHATADEMHNVGDAMVGVQYGMQTGIWWGTAERARGEFCRAAAGGQQLGYGEHRNNWTAASVYRKPNGEVLGFVGGSERQAKTTRFEFVSAQPAFFDGHGPLRSYSVTLPGGTDYQVGQTNAETLVRITSGEDVEPEVMGGTFTIINMHNGRVLRADNTAQQGSGLATYTDASTNNNYHNWEITPVSPTVGGDFSFCFIRNQGSGYVLDDKDWSLEPGTRVIQYGQSGAGVQQWALQYAGDNSFYIRNRHSGLYLQIDIDHNSANIIQAQFSGRDAQKWRFVNTVGTFTKSTTKAAAPTEVEATPQAASVKVSWKYVSYKRNFTYDVLRADEADGPYYVVARGVVADAASQTCSWVDGDVVPGHTYYYKVREVNVSLYRSLCSEPVAAAATGEQGLVADYRFDNDLLDNTVNLNHAALYGATFEASDDDHALVLDGTDDYVQLPYGVAHSKAITVSAWVYWNSGAAWQRIFDFGTDTEHYMFLTPYTGSGMRFTLKNGGDEQYISTTMFPIRKWTHVAVTLGENGAALYLDGVLKASSSSITISPSQFKPFLNYIGRSQFASDPTFKGKIERFSIYNYALSETEIGQLAGIITNGINTVEQGTKATVRPDGATYNMAGQRTAPDARGLVIKNGRKVVR